MQNNFNSASPPKNPSEAGRELLEELNGPPSVIDHEKCLRLIRAGADMEAPSRDPANLGELPLHIALRLGLDDIAGAMIDAGASLSAKDPSGNNALMNTAVYGRLEMAQKILGRGLQNLDDTNDSGYTALIWAGYWGKADIALMLIRAGAKTDAKDHQGYTALGWAEENQNFSNPETVAAIKLGIEEVLGERKRYEDWRDAGMPLKTEIKVLRPLTLKPRTASFVG